jgi:hypothetical protein
MSKTIIYAGYSTLNGKLKFRTAATEGRVHQLARTDDDLHMIEIKPCETKAQAAKQLLAMDYAKGNVAVEELFTYKTLDENPFALSKKKATVVVKVPTTAMAKLVGAKVEVSEKMSAKEAAKIRDEFNARVREAYEAN